MMTSSFSAMSTDVLRHHNKNAATNKKMELMSNYLERCHDPSTSRKSGTSNVMDISYLDEIAEAAPNNIQHYHVATTDIIDESSNKPAMKVMDDTATESTASTSSCCCIQDDDERKYASFATIKKQQQVVIVVVEEGELEDVPIGDTEESEELTEQKSRSLWSSRRWLTRQAPMSTANTTNTTTNEQQQQQKQKEIPEDTHQEKEKVLRSPWSTRFATSTIRDSSSAAAAAAAAATATTIEETNFESLAKLGAIKKEAESSQDHLAEDAKAARFGGRGRLSSLFGVVVTTNKTLNEEEEQTVEDTESDTSSDSEEEEEEVSELAPTIPVGARFGRLFGKSTATAIASVVVEGAVEGTERPESDILASNEEVEHVPYSSRFGLLFGKKAEGDVVEEAEFDKTTSEDHRTLEETTELDDLSGDASKEGEPVCTSRFGRFFSKAQQLRDDDAQVIDMQDKASEENSQQETAELESSIAVSSDSVEGPSSRWGIAFRGYCAKQEVEDSSEGEQANYNQEDGDSDSSSCSLESFDPDRLEEIDDGSTTMKAIRRPWAKLWRAQEFTPDDSPTVHLI